MVAHNVLVGMNSTILHDAEIGGFCIIGASCLVGEGMKVPDRSFVAGIPAKIKGQVSEKQLYWMQQAPRNYTKLARRYKEQGL